MSLKPWKDSFLVAVAQTARQSECVVRHGPTLFDRGNWNIYISARR
jgi:hypothetical protein